MLGISHVFNGLRSWASSNKGLQEQRDKANHDVRPDTVRVPTHGELTQHNPFYRWFISLAMDDPVRAPTIFNKNRARVLEHHTMIEAFN